MLYATAAPQPIEHVKYDGERSKTKRVNLCRYQWARREGKVVNDATQDNEVVFESLSRTLFAENHLRQHQQRTDEKADRSEQREEDGQVNDFDVGSTW